MEKEISLEDVYRKLVSLELFMKKFGQLAEDLEFARRTEDAYERIESGDYVSIDSERLTDEMKKW
jgi:hypothetical protein